MRKIVLLIVCLYIGGVIVSGLIDKVEANSVFKLMGKDLKHNQTLPFAQVYNGYGCSGGNKSPELYWLNAPNNTKSFAIICHDPDAPHENGWYHWLVVNIPSNITSVKQGAKIKDATETLTDFGSVGYGGACPPVGHGIHHYNFTVYALDTDKIDVLQDEKPKDVEKKVLSHAIAKSTITALYERK